MRLLSYYLPQAPWILVYMLQQKEYNSNMFAAWATSFPPLRKVMHRQRLVKTARSVFLLGAAYFIWVGVFAMGLYGIIAELYPLVAALVLLPLISIVWLWLVNTIFGALIVRSAEKREITAAKRKLTQTSALKIAVLGSYGKTTMKELLATILCEGFSVAATPGNKNVLISHARWVASELTGQEDILIFEYGEYRPGDIRTLAEFSQPDWAIVTGLAPAHIDTYGSLDAITTDFMSVFEVCQPSKVLVNGDSPQLREAFDKGLYFTTSSVMGWEIKDVSNSIDGLRFNMSKGSKTLHIRSQLIGEHLIGPLAACAALVDKLGMDAKAIEAGAAKTRPFEHRMQPYKLGAATIIDDTYNGNLEGMKAGLRLLQQTDAPRKIYVTPGLVEQGDLTREVHKELGKAIASAKPTKVVLMNNSVTGYIQEGLKVGNYKGEVHIESDPVGFYTNLEHFVAAGDVVMMQNDWPDAYA